MMFKMPVVASLDVNVKVESHFSKVPASFTDAFTKNLTELSSTAILKTGTSAGACARAKDGEKVEANRQRIGSRMTIRIGPRVVFKVLSSLWSLGLVLSEWSLEL